ncbi:MAG: ADP-ribosylglycohydrolase family protein [Thermodesulfobacteriota bacterium]|nr:MAG: ADP-ribosylglycohydrolase family protein [Thermodesulfobacteriota bacterium]
MIGAIAGDIIGSIYEVTPVKSTDFPLFSKFSTFTDDTVLTVAVASAILEKADYKDALKEFAIKYPDRGYGMYFYEWAVSKESAPYNSFGNGSAMRVTPVGFAFSSIEEVLDEAKKSAEVTHNHPEGIKGAQATALAVFLARTGKTKEEIKGEIEKRFHYDLSRTLDGIRPDYVFNATCEGTVPEAMISFLESTDYEDAVRKAVSLGGDSDTLASIAGAIAEAFYKKVPEEIIRETRQRLSEEFLTIIDEFEERFGV